MKDSPTANPAEAKDVHTQGGTAEAKNSNQDAQNLPTSFFDSTLEDGKHSEEDVQRIREYKVAVNPDMLKAAQTYKANRKPYQ